MQKQGAHSSDNIYTVERLVDSRIRQSKIEYLVKWKNWSDIHNTWEPESNILDKELIGTFLRKKRRASKSAKPRVVAYDTPDSALRSTAVEQLRARDRKAKTERSNTVKFSRISNEDDRFTEVDHRPPDSPTEVPKISPKKLKLHSRPSGTIGGQHSECVSSHRSAISVTSSSPEETEGDWHLEKRLRKTTLLVATASMSAASSLTGIRSRMTDGNRAVSSLDNSPVAANDFTYSCPAVQESLRPKLRLKIPRQRLLINPVTSFPSCSLSIGYKDVDDEMRHWHFQVPVEMPRRTIEIHYEDQPLLEPREMKTPSINSYDEKLTRKDSNTSKVLLSFKRHNSTHSKWSNSPYCFDNQKQHSHKKEKRSKRKNGGEVKNSPVFNLPENLHSPSTSSSYSSTTGSTTSPTTTCESPPRIAPLRIQLSRTTFVKPFDSDRPERTEVHGSPTPDIFISTSRMSHIEPQRDMSITDVTVGNLTITIKECSSPDNFFGVPSSQLIQKTKLTPTQEISPTIDAIYNDVSETRNKETPEQNGCPTCNSQIPKKEFVRMEEFSAEISSKISSSFSSPIFSDNSTNSSANVDPKKIRNLFDHKFEPCSSATPMKSQKNDINSERNIASEDNTKSILQNDSNVAASSLEVNEIALLNHKQKSFWNSCSRKAMKPIRIAVSRTKSLIQVPTSHSIIAEAIYAFPTTSLSPTIDTSSHPNLSHIKSRICSSLSSAKSKLCSNTILPCMQFRDGSTSLMSLNQRSSSIRFPLLQQPTYVLPTIAPSLINTNTLQVFSNLPSCQTSLGFPQLQCCINNSILVNQPQPGQSDAVFQFVDLSAITQLQLTSSNSHSSVDTNDVPIDLSIKR